MGEHVVNFDEELEAAIIAGGTTADEWIASGLESRNANLLQSYRAEGKQELINKIDSLTDEQKAEIFASVDNAIAANQIQPSPPIEVKP